MRDQWEKERRIQASRSGVHMGGRWDGEGRIQPSAPTKHTFLHITMQEYNEENHHFLVPRLSEQADNDSVKVSAFDLRPEQSHRTTGARRSTHGGPQRQTSCCLLPDFPSRGDRKSPASPQAIVPPSPPCIRVGFTGAMRPSGYAESVSVSEAPPSQDTSVATFCEQESEPHFKSSVEIVHGLSPAWFQSRIVCHGTTTKKNFRSSVDYVPKMKPCRYEETNYVRPKHLVTTYVSYYDYNSNDNDRWYTTTVHFVPAPNGSNTVNNYQMRPADGQDITAQVTVVNGDVDDVFGDSDSDEHNRGPGAGDINMNIINKSLTVAARQPPMLMSSGPEDDDELRFGSTRLSHRTKMVVETAPGQSGMSGEDYVVYLQGYASTGEVVSHGFEPRRGLSNGYLSSDEDISEV